MAKSKDGPSLLELIGKRHRSRPDGSIGFRQSWRAARDEVAPGIAKSGAAIPPASDSSSAESPQTKATPPPLFEIDGGRVVFSFSSGTAGMAVFALALLVAAGFFVGLRAGRQEGQESGFRAGVESVRAESIDGIEAARNAAPKSGIFNGVGVSPVRSAGSAQPDRKREAERVRPQEPAAKQAKPESGPSQWVLGHTYIVVQEFRSGDRADAEAARVFLRLHGVETAILASQGSYGHTLVTLKGFNRDDPVQRKLCEEFHDQIRQLGKLFAEAGGRYDLQGYQKKVTSIPP
ncbi:MAG: hypothetical protein IID39_04045 [Planctomycetes bacterium]|nr:hypothetical protein [Planctomycetota bacterium]